MLLRGGGIRASYEVTGIGSVTGGFRGLRVWGLARRHRRVLVAELGAEPGAALHQRILAGDSVLVLC